MHGNPSVALSLFDWGVNSGPRRSSKAFQKIIGANPDGKIGPKTLALAKDQSDEYTSIRCIKSDNPSTSHFPSFRSLAGVGLAEMKRFRKKPYL